MTKPPNMRVQRTRSSPSALRSPLTRGPLGRTNELGSYGARLLACAAVCFLVGVPYAWATSALNIGLLGKLDDVSVLPVLIGSPLGLEDETWRPLFADDARGAESLSTTLATEITQRLKAAGLKVSEKSRNQIWVSIYGGGRVVGSCALNTFLVEVWVGAGESSARARAVMSEATNAELAEKLRAAALEVIDELVAQRARYRESLKEKR